MRLPITTKPTPTLKALAALLCAPLALSLACTQPDGQTTTSSSGNSSGANVDVKLDPPAAGQGWQWTTGEFEVPAATEQQDCYFFQVPGTGTEPVFVNKVTVAMNDGSHHMNLFRVRTILGLNPANGAVQRAQNGMGECFKSPNWADWPLVMNSQQGGNIEWELPTGVAHKFAPGEWIMLQTHYVNATTQMTPSKGKVLVNFHTQAASAVQHELGTLFATKQSIRICQSNPQPRFEGSCQFNGTEPVHIIGANGHFHSRGTQFEMFDWNGTRSTTPPATDRFYVSDSWDDPPMMRSPELDRTVPAGGGVWYTCSYDWQEPPPSVGCSTLNTRDANLYMTQPEDLDCCYTFGGVVDMSEHCNIFVYYWPKVDDVNCF
jgi:hypothetical protein